MNQTKSQNYGQDYVYQNIEKSNPFDFKNNQPASQIKDRKVTSNREDKGLPDNSIHTNKYNVFTFLPKNLFEQYSKVANVYFLLLGVMQIIQPITNSDGLPTIWLPLCIINCATSAKDLYEDIKRSRQDREENTSQTNVVTTMGSTKCDWADLRVGTLIKVEKNEFFPCDVLIINTSESKGECYIETKNLDGETNLKQKSTHKNLFSLYKNEEYFAHNIVFEYERPNAYLYKFNGRVTTAAEEKISIDQNNFILRGCSLRNTKWVVGMCAYTGHDTKLMMNSFSARAKRSHLEVAMNNIIFVVFGVMCVLSVFSSIYYVVSSIETASSSQYLYGSQTSSNQINGTQQFFINFFSWILNLSNLVPISLLVTLELVKMIQGIFISQDPAMVYQETQIPTQVQSSSLNEELGQVEYVFSDKTGTLTCNIMEFKKVSIGGISYGEVKKGQMNYVDDISNHPKVTNVDFRDKQLIEAVNDPHHTEHEIILKTLFILALCHTIITEKQENELIYNASSPDELALINFAKFVGVQFTGMDASNNMEVRFQNKNYRYELLHVLEFNSTRKRQSVILRDEQNNILLYCKGADSIILDRIDKKMSENVPETVANLSDYGRIGLRTLLLAERQLDGAYFEQWNRNYMEACSSLERRDERMDALQEEIEVELVIVAATAIEDRLQDQVGETIDALLKQGIKVWVLTGDKIETAINIAISCKLITQDMTQIIVDEKEEPALIKALEDALIQLNQADTISAAFIISGDALLHGLKHNISKKIMQIGELVKSVVCCRVSPKQKQEIVSLVRREKPLVVTLAIGDGANDVNMITAAHVGVGIKGLEGAQAARASDYAIGEFKLLQRLLFHHGRECYRRNSYLILFNFFKNILLVMPQFWFGVFDYFSGPSFYDNYTYQCFNVLFASWPIMIYSIFDQEVQTQDLVKNQMNYYDVGMKATLFNPTVFVAWCCNATAQSMIITYFAIFSCESTFSNTSGQNLEFWITGVMIFQMVVIVSNVKVLIISTEYSQGSILMTVFSILFYFVALLISTNLSYASGQLYNDIYEITTTANFHLGCILIVCTTSLLDLGVQWWQRWELQWMRKQNYLIRLELDLLQKEDMIVFTPMYFDGPDDGRSNYQNVKKVKVNFLPLQDDRE